MPPNIISPRSLLRLPQSDATQPPDNRPELPSPRTAMLMTLDAWWKKLKPWGSLGKEDYFKQDEVASTSKYYPCPKSEHTIVIDENAKGPVLINATEINYEGVSYNIGQTPTAASLPGIIAHLRNTILHKNGPPPGLIQIVSPETHAREKSSRTIVGMVRAKLNEDTSDSRTRLDSLRAKLHMRERPLQQSVELPPIVVGSPMKLVGIRELKNKKGMASPNFRRYTIDVALKTVAGKYRRFSVPLTQISLPFDGVIKAEDKDARPQVTPRRKAELERRAKQIENFFVPP